MDFGFGGTDVDAESWSGSKRRDTGMGIGAGLTGGSVRRWCSCALVGRVDVEDLDPARGSVVDEEILGGAELDEHGGRAGCLGSGLVLRHKVIASRTRQWCCW